MAFLSVSLSKNRVKAAGVNSQKQFYHKIMPFGCFFRALYCASCPAFLIFFALSNAGLAAGKSEE